MGIDETAHKKKEMLSYSLRSKHLDLAAVEKVLEEAEKETGVSSNFQVEKDEEARFFPGFNDIVIKVGKEFVAFVIEKYGSTFLEWLEKKLGVEKEEGDQLKEDTIKNEETPPQDE